MSNRFPLLASLLLLAASASAADAPEAETKKKAWYEKLSLKGYTQVRYNRLLESNQNLVCESCDRSLGDNGHFFIRRARITLSGDVHERVYVYIQPDFASNPTSGQTGQNYFQIRDAYFDLAADSEKELRFRIGQSKVPFGFDNLQSSSNRAAFDRSDALNASAPNERDVGVFVYWAPDQIRKRLKDLANERMKGTGDYGVLGFGVYNGQSMGTGEANDNLHAVARLTYPVLLGDERVIEPSIQAYRGLYAIAPGTNFRDERVAASLVFYPQPIGFQLEAVVGNGPEYDRAAGSTVERKLKGGYAQVMVDVPGLGDGVRLFPYARGQFYHGGKKNETAARSHLVRELEIGTEWQPFSAFEMTAAYVFADRRTSDTANPLSDQEGRRLRLQAQFNY